MKTLVEKQTPSTGLRHPSLEEGAVKRWSECDGEGDPLNRWEEETGVKEVWSHFSGGSKLQALVYDILPSTTAVFSYATGSRKLSANEQFFAGAQTVVSWLQTTQIISVVCFITDHVAYASSNKTKIV